MATIETSVPEVIDSQLLVEKDCGIHYGNLGLPGAQEYIAAEFSWEI